MSEEEIKFRDIGEEMIVKKFFQTNIRFEVNENNTVERKGDWIIDPKLIESFLKAWDEWQNRPPISDG